MKKSSGGRKPPARSTINATHLRVGLAFVDTHSP
jgi:hypothetical protein